jgi:hypothetical protein
MKKIESYNYFDPDLEAAFLQLIKENRGIALAIYNQMNSVIVSKYDDKSEVGRGELIAIHNSPEQKALRRFLKNEAKIKVDSKLLKPNEIVALWYLLKRNFDAEETPRHFSQS